MILSAQLARFDSQSLVRAALAACALASVLLAVMYFRHVPMSPDGGWYAYPSFAWAEGGDPSENMTEFSKVAGAGDRPVARFGWENRLNLTVPVMGAWFEMFPASAGTIALLGVLQWLAIAGLAGAAVILATGDRMLGAAAAIFTLSDSRLIAEAISDARPDVPVLLTALALLVALVASMRNNGTIARLAAVMLAVALPLVHVTSANVIAALGAFLALAALLEWRSGRPARHAALLLAPALVMVVVFLARQPILDVLVPTTVPPELEAVGQHSLIGKLKAIIATGAAAKLGMEWTRWAQQFHAANLAHLAFLLSGIAALLALGREALRDPVARTSTALYGGILAGIIVMAAVDPHETPGHAMVLAVVGYAAAAIAIARWMVLSPTRVAPVAMVAVAGLLAGAAALKLAHTGLIHWRYGREGISVAAVRQALDAALPAPGERSVVRIEGASEVWPYLTERGQRIEIDDRDRYMVPRMADALPAEGAAVIVVTDDHYKAGWGALLNRWREAGLVTREASIGSCARTSRCMEIWRVVAK
ncbi:MAG: hypothetical protein AB7E80_03650 [Hyphomicrobiaceae bacterium]